MLHAARRTRTDEYQQGRCPARFTCRGQLEFSIEGLLPDKAARLRSSVPAARAAPLPKTLQDLGYSDVVSLVGGFNRWKDEGLDGHPHTLTKIAASLSRHLFLPEVGEAGQMKLLDSKVLVLGAEGSAHRTRSTSLRRGTAGHH